MARDKFEEKARNVIVTKAGVQLQIAKRAKELCQEEKKASRQKQEEEFNRECAQAIAESLDIFDAAWQARTGIPFPTVIAGQSLPSDAAVADVIIARVASPSAGGPPAHGAPAPGAVPVVVGAAAGPPPAGGAPAPGVVPVVAGAVPVVAGAAAGPLLGRGPPAPGAVLVVAGAVLVVAGGASAPPHAVPVVGAAAAALVVPPAPGTIPPVADTLPGDTHPCPACGHRTRAGSGMERTSRCGSGV